MDKGWRQETLGGGIHIWVSEDHGFGTDAILLAHFARPKPRENACDLGSGCGIIPLLWSRQAGQGMLYGVELQEAGVKQAMASVQQNGLQDRVRFFWGDLRRLGDEIPKASLDLVTCNPPYQKGNTGFVSQRPADKLARHELSCTLGDVAQCASRLLRFGGRLAICQRPARLADAITAMIKAGIEPKRLRLVQKRPECAPWLFLLEGRKGGKSAMEILPPLIVHEADGSYSQDMLAIYGPYKEAYLK